MKLLDQIGRLFVTMLLLVAGVVLIWYVGQQYADPQPSSKKNSSAPLAVPVKPAAIPPKAAALPESQSSLVPQASSPPAAATEKKFSGFVTTERGKFIATDPILFNSGASTLRESSIPKLDKIARLLKEHPDVDLEIIGHTDNLGNEPVNQKVSSERAAAVMDYLVSQGIDRSRLKSKGMGSLDPISSNDTQLGRQANRRIEFLVIERGSTR